MKRILLAAAALVLALPGGAIAAPRDSAVGSGLNRIGRISFAAHGGPAPFAPASGHFTAKGQLAELGGMDVGPFHFEGPVTCLTVNGNKAGLFYPIKNAQPETFEGQGVFITLEDNGNPASGDPPDRGGFLGPVPAPSDPLLCPPGLVEPLDVLQGNITIRDAP